MIDSVQNSFYDSSYDESMPLNLLTISARHGVLPGVRVGHHRGAQDAAPRGGDLGHLRRLPGRAVLPAPAGPHPQGHQGGQHPAHRQRRHQAGRLRLCLHRVAGQQLRGDALLDGARGDPGHGRGAVRRQGGRLVARHHLRRAGRAEAALLQHERHVGALPHCSEREPHDQLSGLERGLPALCRLLSPEKSL